VFWLTAGNKLECQTLIQSVKQPKMSVCKIKVSETKKVKGLHGNNLNAIS